jgi:hypothetical protein
MVRCRKLLSKCKKNIIMKNSVLILLGLVLPLLAASQGTPRFEVAYSGNGNNHMTIYLTQDLVGNLVAGDEIGIFDGEICVGALVLNAAVTGVVEVITSKKDDGLNNGFTIGNDIIIKVYDSGKAKEFGIVQVSYYDTENKPIEPVKFTANGSAFVKVAAYHPATITGPEGSILRYSTGNIYTTESNMDNYVWNVPGGTIKSGAGTNTISVFWNEAGPQTVTVSWKYEDSEISNGATLETTITDRILLNVKVFLEGPYNVATGTMNTIIRPLLPLQQPYNVAPFNYNGTESVESVDDIPATIVDWVLVELRAANMVQNATSSTIIARQAAFLKNNGKIINLNGAEALQFLNQSVPEGTSLFIVVRHRNHLDIIGAMAANQHGNGTHEYDFTTSGDKVFGGNKSLKLTGSVYSIAAGDIDPDGNVFVSDYNAWIINFGKSGYHNADLNLDGNVFVSDYNSWIVNFGSSTNNLLK